jgi:hypothetical protein
LAIWNDNSVAPTIPTIATAAIIITIVVSTINLIPLVADEDQTDTPLHTNSFHPRTVLYLPPFRDMLEDSVIEELESVVDIRK